MYQSRKLIDPTQPTHFTEQGDFNRVEDLLESLSVEIVKAEASSNVIERY
jgi:hypothetical protein